MCVCVCVCVCVCTCAKALPRPFSDQPLPRAPTSRRCVSFCDKEVESDGGNGEIALFQSEGKSEGKAKNTAVARAAAHRVVVTRLPSRIIVCDDCEYIPVGTRAVQGEQKHAHPIPVSTCLLCAVCALFLYVCLNHSLTHCLSLSLSHSLTHSLCLSVSVSPHHSSSPPFACSLLYLGKDTHHPCHPSWKTFVSVPRHRRQSPCHQSCQIQS